MPQNDHKQTSIPGGLNVGPRVHIKIGQNRAWNKSWRGFYRALGQYKPTRKMRNIKVRHPTNITRSYQYTARMTHTLIRGKRQATKRNEHGPHVHLSAQLTWASSIWESLPPRQLLDLGLLVAFTPVPLPAWIGLRHFMSIFFMHTGQNVRRLPARNSG